MYVLPVIVAVAVLGIAAMVAAGKFGEMSTEPIHDRFVPDVPADRPIAATDLESVRFSSAARGYDMEQVDDLVERLSAEVEDRDAELEQWRAGRTPQRQAAAHPKAPAERGVPVADRASQWRGEKDSEDSGEAEELPGELAD